MRSIALVVAGLVAGFAAGQFSVKKIQNEIPTAEVQTKIFQPHQPPTSTTIAT